MFLPLTFLSVCDPGLVQYKEMVPVKIIVGACVGGGLFLIIVLSAIVVMLCKRKASDQSHQQQTQVQSADDLNLNGPTDSSPNENPEAVTSEYLTISESGSTSENSHALAGQYDNVNGRDNQYQTINMVDISATVNTYDAIRH